MMKTNPVLKDEIATLEKAARQNDAPIYDDVAEALKKATRSQAEVNLSRIQRNAEKGDTVVVPGKVLGAGRLTKDVSVAAFQFSQSAREAIEENGTAIYLDNLVDENPSGEQLRIMK